MAIIYQTFLRPDANYCFHVTQERGLADLRVYSVTSKGMAYGDKLWFITRLRGEATSRIYFGSRGQAELVIYFVDNWGEAGWQRPHRLSGYL